MKDEPKHTKIRKFIPREDGTMEIHTDSYHHKHSSYKEEWLKNIQTSNRTLLSDIVACLDVLKGTGTPELIITVISGDDGIPFRITKQWTVKKENFNNKNY